MANYYGKRRAFSLRAEKLDTMNMTADAVEIEGVRIYVEYPDDAPPVLIIQRRDGTPLRIGALAINTISLHRSRD